MQQRGLNSFKKRTGATITVTYAPMRVSGKSIASRKDISSMTARLSIHRLGGLDAKFSIGAFLLVASMLTLLAGAISYSTSNLIEHNAGDEMTDKAKLLVTLIEASDKELQARTRFLANIPGQP